MNAQSLVKHFDEIKYFVQSKNPIALCLTETHVTSEIDDDEINIGGYKIERVDSESRHTGGVIFYIRADIQHNVLLKHVICMNVWFLVLKFKINNEFVTVAGLYHSSNQPHRAFLDFIENWLDNNLINVSHTFLMIGDFNIDWKSDLTYSLRLKAMSQDFALKQLVGVDTHIHQRGGSIIDLVFSNDRRTVINVLEEPNICNHSCVGISVKNTRQNKSVVVRSKLRNKDELCKDISNFVNVFNYYNTDLNGKYNTFFETMTNIVNVHMPEKEIMLRSGYKGWFNDRVLAAIKKRDESYKRYRLSFNQNDWETYKQDRNEVVKVLRMEKCKYYEEKIDSCVGNPREMWKSLKHITGQKEKPTIDVINFDGALIEDMNVIVEKFNRFFVESVENIVDTIPNNSMEFTINNSTSRFCDFTLTDRSMLREVIFSLPNKSSPDDIDMFIYREFFDLLCDPLINIINSSLLSGEIPDLLKTSTIALLRKVSGTIKPEEFRPINMLPAFEKILEKVVYLQIKEYVSENRLMCEYQSGFRENHSCESAIQCSINDWKEAYEEGKATAVIFLDLKRAFETINRAKLIEKLQCLGFEGNVLKWLRNYLSSRRQKVKYEDCVSTEIEVGVGVPQGSILGPLLFVLYMNDISSVCKSVNYHLFADDTIIYLSDLGIDELVVKTNKILESVSDWMEVNKLKLNITKTKGMIIGKKSHREAFLSSNLELKLCGQRVEIVEEMKYLGVVIDNTLKFNKNIDYVCKKIAKKIGMLRRVSWYLTIRTRKLVFNTIVLPHFHFCSTVLYLSDRGHIDRLQKLQNRAMRVILGCGMYTRVDDMLNVLGWLKIQKFLEFNVLVFIHKIKLTQQPIYLQKLLHTFEENHDYNTRGRQNIILQRARTEVGHNSIFSKGVNLYNGLSKAIKDTRSIVSFKRMLKSKGF